MGVALVSDLSDKIVRYGIPRGFIPGIVKGCPLDRSGNAPDRHTAFFEKWRGVRGEEKNFFSREKKFFCDRQKFFHRKSRLFPNSLVTDHRTAVIPCNTGGTGDDQNRFCTDPGGNLKI